MGSCRLCVRKPSRGFSCSVKCENVSHVGLTAETELGQLSF